MSAQMPPRSFAENVLLTMLIGTGALLFFTLAAAAVIVVFKLG
jgi:hypothetical protein